MNVEYAFLCDYADAFGAKLTAVGIGIDTIYADAVPAAHTQIFAVLAVKFTRNETRRVKEIEMRLQDADGSDVIPPAVGSIDIQAPVEGMTYRTHRTVNGLYGLRFEKFGDYQVSWLVDGSEAHTLHFRVARPPR